MAAVREGVVCWMYDVDHWKLVKGWNPYVLNLLRAFDILYKGELLTPGFSGGRVRGF